jgi:hypothetical protein
MDPADSGHHPDMLKSILTTALLLSVVPASAQAIRHGHVRLIAMSPATVHGSGFYAKERVTVTVRGASAVMRKSVISTTGGAFTLRFGSPAPSGGCQGLAVSAVGARGDRADWKSAPPVCGTPLAP